jgi:hypothetical protein
MDSASNGPTPSSLVSGNWGASHYLATTPGVYYARHPL